MSEERGMTAFLEFPLPECEEQHKDALNGTRWRCTVQAYEEQLRRKMKDLACAESDDEDHIKEMESVRDGLFIARDLLYDECDLRGLVIWE